MKDTIFNYVQLDVLWEKFWPLSHPPPPPTYFNRIYNSPTLGTAENPKGEAGDIMVKSHF